MAKSLPTLCSPEACTACSACANICPVSAITMVENAYGEHHPSVDPDKCLGCKLCEKTCPEANPNLTTKNAAPTVYSCWLRNADDRKQSTSGGAAFAISSAVIRQGGHVWGAAFDANLQCRYTEANTIQQLRPIQKSKYVQSFVGDAFQKIKAELDNGDLVLFCGTGCHVKGLLAFLRRPYDNLLTLDLVCHGVPGQGSFRKYVSWLETKYSDRVINYVPRYKRPDGQELRFCRMASFERKGDVRLVLQDDSFYTAFVRGLTLRDNCFACAANGELRFSDFTVADFWGIGKIKPFHQNRQRPRGISMLALNSQKARDFFPKLSDLLESEERSYKEASLVNSPYYKSATKSPHREAFRSDYTKLTWDSLADKYMRFSLKQKIAYAIKSHVPPFISSMLNHWAN